MRSSGVSGDHGEGDAKVSNPQRGGSTTFEMLGTSGIALTATIARRR